MTVMGEITYSVSHSELVGWDSKPHWEMSAPWTVPWLPPEYEFHSIPPPTTHNNGSSPSDGLPIPPFEWPRRWLAHFIILEHKVISMATSYESLATTLVQTFWYFPVGTDSCLSYAGAYPPKSTDSATDYIYFPTLDMLVLQIHEPKHKCILAT